MSMLTLLIVLSSPTVACHDVQTFNYGRVTVEETVDGFKADLNATALTTELNHKGLKAVGWLHDLTLTFPKAACKTSAPLITCHTTEEVEFSFRKGKDRRVFKATYATLEIARVTRVTVSGTTEKIEPTDCEAKKAPVTPKKKKTKK